MDTSNIPEQHKWMFDNQIQEVLTKIAPVKALIPDNNPELLLTLTLFEVDLIKAIKES